MDDFTNKMDAMNGLTIRYTGGTTNLADALKILRNDVFIQNSGDRDDVHNIAVIILDGKTDDPMETWAQASQTRDEGTTVLVIAVGAG